MKSGICLIDLFNVKDKGFCEYMMFVAKYMMNTISSSVQLVNVLFDHGIEFNPNNGSAQVMVAKVLTNMHSKFIGRPAFICKNIHDNTMILGPGY